MTTTTTITDAQIQTLRAEAAQAGDREQVSICNYALDGDEDCRAECASVIGDAAVASVVFAYGLSDEDTIATLKQIVDNHGGNIRAAAWDYTDANPDASIEAIEAAIRELLGTE
jgi:hypothetical protein